MGEEEEKRGGLKLLGYIRVSTLPQVKGTSMDVQREAIERYCQVHGHTLLKVYTDKGKSGVLKRPQQEKLMKRCMEDSEVNGVICYDLTRFGRDTIELLTNIQLLEKEGKKFISVKENIDTSTSTGELILQIMSAIAEFERKKILERLQEGREWAKIHGTKSGKPMHRPKKDVNWELVRELRELGLSWNKIAQHWNKSVKSKKEKISVATLIRRAREEGIE